MSQTNSSVSVVFDLQRNAIEQTHEAVKRGLDTQQELVEVFFDFDPVKQANKGSYDAARTVVDVYFDAVKSTTPGQQELLGDFRATVDEQLDTLEANQLEAIEAVEGNAQKRSESADKLFENVIVALDEQFEAFLDAHMEAEDKILKVFEGGEDNLEVLQAEFETQLEQSEDQVTEHQQSVEGRRDDTERSRGTDGRYN